MSTDYKDGVIVSNGALQMVLNALERDAKEGKVIRQEMVDSLKQTIRPIPKPNE